MAETPTPLDSDWLRANPLPDPAVDADKNDRGRVLVIGGSSFVPGGIALTAEAALRAGAGKVQVVTIASAAIPIGVTMPEIAVIALEETDGGDIVSQNHRLLSALSECDAVVAGPAMNDVEAASALVKMLVDAAMEDSPSHVIILDAAALLALPPHADALRRCRRPVVLTPHIGELAAMLQMEAEEVSADCPTALRRAAELFSATVMLKGPTSYVADPHGDLFAFAGGGVGLATGGSGDVLAGIVGGLAARGACPRDALLWAVWLHGEAGRRCAEQIGPIGFLARELLAQIPSLMRGV